MSLSGESSSAAVSGGGSDEIMLFGVRVKVDPMRKSVSMNNLSEYEPAGINTSNLSEKELPKAPPDSAAGYASADDAVPQPSSGSGERKRGVPWTEEEHKLFLIGLQNVGKGDWRGISRNYVKTRTPTQVASHAQKYFLRQSNLNRRRRRSSLFDITTDSVTATPMEEGGNHQDVTAKPVSKPTSVPLPVASNTNVFPGVRFPVGPVLLSMQGGNPIENSALGQSVQVNNSPPMLVCPSSTLGNLNLNEEVPFEASPLSLMLSLSTGQDYSSSTRDSAFQVMSNGDSIISIS